jgi:hypothetical protein
MLVDEKILFKYMCLFYITVCNIHNSKTYSQNTFMFFLRFAQQTPLDSSTILPDWFFKGDRLGLLRGRKHHVIFLMYYVGDVSNYILWKSSF